VIKVEIRKSGKVGAGISLTKDLSSYNTETQEKLQKVDNTVKKFFFNIMMTRKVSRVSLLLDALHWLRLVILMIHSPERLIRRII